VDVKLDVFEAFRDIYIYTCYISGSRNPSYLTELKVETGVVGCYKIRCRIISHKLHLESTSSSFSYFCAKVGNGFL